MNNQMKRYTERGLEQRSSVPGSSGWELFWFTDLEGLRTLGFLGRLHYTGVIDSITGHWQLNVIFGPSAFPGSGVGGRVGLNVPRWSASILRLPWGFSKVTH